MSCSRSARSNSDPSDQGPAQFLQGLSPAHLKHLQYSVPVREVPDRFSLFLAQEPRKPPVPKRFTFDALDYATREQHKPTKSPTKSLTRTTTPTTEIIQKEFERVRGVEWKFYLTFLCICILNLMAAWDATSLPIAIPTIATTLDGSAIQSLWLGISFLLAATAFQPVYASCADIFGRKSMLLSALTFFTIGAFIAAVTGNVTGLLLGRSLQGIGAGGIYVLTNLILVDLVCLEQRTRWTFIVGATWAIGIITGPIIGGVLVENGQWRWIFWLNLPFCGFAFLILPALSELKAAKGDMLVGLRRFDWLGLVLLVGSLISVLLGLTRGGIEHRWNNFRTIIPIIAGFMGFLLLCLWSRFSSLAPILDFKSSMNASSIATHICVTAQGILVFAALYFVPLYFSVAKPDLSLVRTGVCLLPWTITLASFAMLTAVFAVNKGNGSRYQPATWLGWFFTTFGVALMILITRTSTPSLWVPVALFSGIGLGILYPSLRASSLAQVAACSDTARLASAITNHSFFQSLGSTFGIAISTSIFQNSLQKNLLRHPLLSRLAQEYSKDAIALVQSIRKMPGGDNTLREDLGDAYTDSMRTIWIVLAVVAGAAFTASFFVKAGGIGARMEVVGEGREMRMMDCET
ncbi:major facilitator superfamily domain-containing protein [Clohesyomyces aquaticus]|uniref:Major facilitator superfamily domain-containing protein n=1 Tax=Clohesyomyces aquaticus TaxID=1231657 RepID=A0A1Y1ZTH9_9PLEO|nr:major facilitator superfamily domain-containing protein [Clohesyomyces aquaticus]